MAAVIATMVQAGQITPAVGVVILAGTSIASSLLPSLLTGKRKGGRASIVGQVLTLVAAIAGAGDQLLHVAWLPANYAVWLLVGTNALGAIMPQLQGRNSSAAPADGGGS
ncbi:MAG: hypothetical protein IPK75_20495 [Acidobacteria bacterium]|nr:hypothetical protein [Acidobacteriota bacterium]